MSQQPYYQDDWVTIYHGDARDVIPQLADSPRVCITDPVWPNSVFPGVADPQGLFRETLAVMDLDRLVVHLGCASDPRFLSVVPASLPFIRVCWLRGPLMPDPVVIRELGELAGPPVFHAWAFFNVLPWVIAAFVAFLRVEAIWLRWIGATWE